MATARPRPPVGEPAAGFEEHGLTWSDTPSRVTISLPMTKERLRALNLRVFTDGNNLTLTSSPATKGKEGTNVLVQVRLYGEVSAAAMEPAFDDGSRRRDSEPFLHPIPPCTYFREPIRGV